MLSIHLQIVYICSEFTFKLYAYAQCICTICLGMLSVCKQFANVCSACAYEHQKTLSKRVTIFERKNPLKVRKMNLFERTFWLLEGRTIIFLTLALQKKCGCICAVRICFPQKFKVARWKMFLGKLFIWDYLTTYLWLASQAHFENARAWAP